MANFPRMVFVACVLVNVLMTDNVPALGATEENTGIDLAQLMRLAPQHNADIPGLANTDLFSATNMDVHKLLEMTNALQGSHKGSEVTREFKGVDAILDMTNALQESHKGSEFRMEFKGANPGDPVVEVAVETLTLDDFMSDEAGRRQLGQLNAHLNSALASLGDNVRMTQEGLFSQGVQHSQQVEESVRGLDNLQKQLSSMMSSGDASGNLNFLSELQTLVKTLDQLPALKDLVENLYTAWEGAGAGLEGDRPITALDWQQLLALSFQGVVGGGGGAGGLQSVEEMVREAVGSITEFMQQADSALKEAQQLITSSPTHLLQALSDARCLLTSLAALQPDVTATARCMQGVMKSVLTPSTAELLTASLTQALHHPPTVQAVTTMLNSPDLSSALTVILTMTSQDDAGIVSQGLQTMLSSLLQNEQMMNLLLQMVHSPQSTSLLRDVMGMLVDVTEGDMVTQQVVLMVNDTVMHVVTTGDLRQALDTIRHVTGVMLQDADQPLSASQREFLDILLKVMDIIKVTLDQTTPSTTPHPPPLTSTPTPSTTAVTSATSTEKHDTTTPTITTTTESKTTLKKATELPSTTTTTSSPTTPSTSMTTTTRTMETSSPAPATTTARSDTLDDDDNGGIMLSSSMLFVVLVSLVPLFVF